MKQSEFVSLVKDTFEKNGYTKVRERSRKLDEKLRKFRLYQNIRDAIGGRYYRK